MQYRDVHDKINKNHILIGVAVAAVVITLTASAYALYKNKK